MAEGDKFADHLLTNFERSVTKLADLLDEQRKVQPKSRVRNKTAAEISITEAELEEDMIELANSPLYLVEAPQHCFSPEQCAALRALYTSIQEAYDSNDPDIDKVQTDFETLKAILAPELLLLKVEEAENESQDGEQEASSSLAEARRSIRLAALDRVDYTEGANDADLMDEIAGGFVNDDSTAIDDGDDLSNSDMGDAEKDEVDLPDSAGEDAASEM